jgi:hypothetical protein
MPIACSEYSTIALVVAEVVGCTSSQRRQVNSAGNATKAATANNR